MTFLPGDPPVHVALRRSARARRFSLRVSRVDGQVTLSLPTWARESEAMAFAREKEDWIRATLAGLPLLRRIEIGGSVPVAGRELSIRPGTGRAPRIEGGVLLVPGDPERAAARVSGFLKVLARERLTEACDIHSRALGRPYARITLRDTRSRWGSCAPDGALMFSWRLAMAPPEVLDYVAAHEVAHLAQMNHSPAFWAVVGRLLPGYEVPRRWLKRNGSGLQAIRFGD
ncbi:MAG: M48 family metallopeptidase [Paracoccaceae bacterium]|nr:M48 family metallopeptidase [Paracoccaceae bacterium]